MLIINVRDNENNRNHKRESQENQGRKEQRGDESYSEWVKAKWFCCFFKVGFLELTYKASLIFKSNLELALWIILKETEL